MSGLHPLSARKIIKKFHAAGFYETHQRGSHLYFKHDGRKAVVAVAIHGGKDIPISLLRTMVVHQAKMTIEEFIGL